MTFNSPLTILNETFGYDQFRDQQAEIIDCLVAGHDALVLMPTGGGKSLCYQIPALIRPGIGIVISPLIALMQDQVNALTELGIRAAYLNSSVSMERQRDIQSDLRSGHIDLLYIAPERLVQSYTRELLQSLPISLFAIDEAHCVSQWGHDFRSDYLQLSLLAEDFPEVPRIALTATADGKTRDEISLRLQLRGARNFVSGFDRPNIRYLITEKHNPRQQLLNFIRQHHADDAGIVYCLSRKKVEATADWLCQQGFSALPYHAGLSAHVRQHNQQRFLRDEQIIIVATIAFGMGIDKPNVRFVAHLDLPKSVEAYYQETGRAGRDGEPASAWLTYGLQDVIKLRQMLDNGEGDEQHKRNERRKLDAMLGLCEIISCRRQAILRYFDDHAPDHCGNCDTCLFPVQTWEATEVVQKALSCVFRSGQRFGVVHLIDILLGAENAKISQHGHQQLSTYGIGKELDARRWQSVYRQMIARGLLTLDADGFGALRLTEQARPVLKGDQIVELRRDNLAKVTKPDRKLAHQTSVKESEKGLWEALRRCRKELAESANLPPYVIFHDATLAEMLRCLPQNERQLLAINGVGAAKMKRYGGTFLAIIQQHGDNPDDGADRQADTIEKLFFAGNTVAEISQQLAIAEKTAYLALRPAIIEGRAKLEQVTHLTDSDLDSIQDCLLAQDDLAETHFSCAIVNRELNSDYPSGALQCVRADILKSL
jgi:ATP-dependent DNA helicase RecQ